MSENKKPTAQEIFNAITNSKDVADIKTHLTEINTLGKKAKNNILLSLEKALLSSFTENRPSIAKIEEDIMFHEMTTYKGITYDKTSEKKLIDSWRIALEITKKVVNDTSYKSSPILKKVMENVSQLNDNEYSDPRHITMSVCKAVKSYKNT